MKIENVGTKYFLHDCVIYKIEIKDSNIIFYSCNGVYEFDDNAGISKMMKKCNIYFKIDNLLEEKSYEHISINIFKKKY